MLEILVNDSIKGQRLDRFIRKLLPNMPTGLLQKSIRKKNITVNKQKTKAQYNLKDNDKIQIFFSDETIEKFKKLREFKDIPDWADKLIKEPVYQDENFIIINKPVGLLSQPDSSNEISVSDIISSYLKPNETFSPAPLNRLDRNTSGIILIPLNYSIQKKASKSIRNHETSKVYLTLVKGEVQEGATLINKYSKDSRNNKANLNGEEEVKLSYKPIGSNGELTLLKVNLETGKSHQIRVQLSEAGIPIVGDPKYGDKLINTKFKQKYNLKNQLLHAWHYNLYYNNNELLNVQADLPEEFINILDGENLNGLLEETT